MEINHQCLTRDALLQEAISNVLRDTFQSSDASERLQNAFPQYSFANEMGTTDSILASLTRIARENALARIDAFMSQQGIKHTIAALDEQGLQESLPSDTEEMQAPSLHLPSATLAEVALSCQQKELQKLKEQMREREETLVKLRKYVGTQVQQLSSLRERLNGSSRIAEQTLQATVPESHG